MARSGTVSRKHRKKSEKNQLKSDYRYIGRNRTLSDFSDTLILANPMIYDVTDLDVYNRSLKALNLVYRLEKQISQSHSKLRVQLTSAAESIPALIAEGFAKRRSDKEWKRFLEMAMGSSDEVITQTRSIQILGKHIPRIDDKLCEEVIDGYKIISKQINSLRNKWVNYSKR